jgi:hypothetical protein
VLSARSNETTRPSVELLACDALDHTDGPTSNVIVYATPDVLAAKNKLLGMGWTLSILAY